MKEGNFIICFLKWFIKVKFSFVFVVLNSFVSSFDVCLLLLHLTMRIIRLIEDFLELYLDRFRQDVEQVFGDLSFVGSRQWNWKFRKMHFWNPNPEHLLHSSYSFWPWLSTSSSGWDLVNTLPWKNCEKLLSLEFKNMGLKTASKRHNLWLIDPWPLPKVKKSSYFTWKTFWKIHVCY